MSPNMTDPRPKLTDRAALLGNRRARLRKDALFLQREARVEIEDRLSLVNKSFQSVAIVTGLPALWSDLPPDSAKHAQIVADEDQLGLPQGQFDLVVHAMALHWADDPVGQLIQCRRALKPDGLFLAVLPGGRSLAGLRAVLGQAEVEIRGGLSPRVLPMAEIRDLGALLQRAGFALPVADSVSLTVEYDDLWALMRDLRAMGEANALAARDKRFTPKALFARAAELYAQTYPGKTKAIAAEFELISLAGWAPAASQQKPLRPGSAQARLADALGATENKLSD